MLWFGLDGFSDLALTGTDATNTNGCWCSSRLQALQGIIAELKSHSILPRPKSPPQRRLSAASPSSPVHSVSPVADRGRGAAAHDASGGSGGSDGSGSGKAAAASTKGARRGREEGAARQRSPDSTFKELSKRLSGEMRSVSPPPKGAFVVRGGAGSKR